MEVYDFSIFVLENGNSYHLMYGKEKTKKTQTWSECSVEELSGGLCLVPLTANSLMQHNMYEMLHIRLGIIS